MAGTSQPMGVVELESGAIAPQDFSSIAMARTKPLGASEREGRETYPSNEISCLGGHRIRDA